jgi:hypothetical protein
MSAAQEFPIFDLPASLRRTAGAAEGPMVAIDGLGDALAECYTRAILPGEHGGLGWATATRARAVVPPPVMKAPPRSVEVARVSKALEV